MLGHAGKELALVGGVECMSRVQVGLSQNFSDWLRRFSQARSLGRRLARSATSSRGISACTFSRSRTRDRQEHGEHCEEMAKTWGIGREAQDKMALASHEKAVAGQKPGSSTISSCPSQRPRATDFRARTQPRAPGEAAAGFRSNQRQRDDHRRELIAAHRRAAGLWVATGNGVKRLPGLSRERGSSIGKSPRSTSSTRGCSWRRPTRFRACWRGTACATRYRAVGDHEAFSAQVLWQPRRLRERELPAREGRRGFRSGKFPLERLNPNGGSVALGHPFGATGARILSQAVKELAAMPKGSRAVVSICADGGLGTVALLQAE